eukprot:TRINITY_DN10078_c0_g1_i1.p1 TRINITY_DN10078_c0_g1~~TRINITY_DN10078_c0_g1_i1.p1  ORF type:complete len:216 (+),score=38.37 TRINITY_DN10078_c0_g1_i1:579-1226(+)
MNLVCEMVSLFFSFSNLSALPYDQLPHSRDWWPVRAWNSVSLPSKYARLRVAFHLFPLLFVIGASALPFVWQRALLELIFSGVISIASLRFLYEILRLRRNLGLRHSASAGSFTIETSGWAVQERRLRKLALLSLTLLVFWFPLVLMQYLPQTTDHSVRQPQIDRFSIYDVLLAASGDIATLVGVFVSLWFFPACPRQRLRLQSERFSITSPPSF